MADIPINRKAPPFGQTAAGLGERLAHVLDHLVVQHPNQSHSAMPAMTPFREGAGSTAGWAGRARHSPAFTSGNGLFRGNRK